MNRIYPTLYARLMANSVFEEETGCWLWTGQRSRRGGYPQVSIRLAGKHKTLRAHRMMAEIVLRRSLRADETVEHACLPGPNTLCICPSHFGLLSRADNTRSMRARVNGAVDLTEMTPLWGVNGDNCRWAHYSEPIPF